MSAATGGAAAAASPASRTSEKSDMRVVEANMKQLDFLDVFAFICGLVFIAFNKTFASVARDFQLRNFEIDHGTAVFRVAFLLFGSIIVLVVVVRMF